MGDSSAPITTRLLRLFDAYTDFSRFYRVLRKYLNQNSVIFEPFDTGKFIDLCKKQ